jgi:hypothetical protein
MALGSCGIYRRTMMRQVLNPLGFSRDFTHVKQPYFAYCVQHNGDNTKELINLIKDAGGEAVPYGKDMLVRWKGTQKPSIDIFFKGMWLRQGENGMVKLMSDIEFKLKYETLHR